MSATKRTKNHLGSYIANETDSTLSKNPKQGNKQRLTQQRYDCKMNNVRILFPDRKQGRQLITGSTVVDLEEIVR